jgi:hypothetical protein
MTLLMLVLGVASIFCSGVLAQAYGTKNRREDFYVSIIGFCSGLFILISMIGAVV